MAEQPQMPEGVTPEQFFEQLLPMGFAAQVAETGSAPAEFTICYRVSGEGGGEWLVKITGADMQVSKGGGEANLTMTVSLDDWRDAVMARDGAALSLIVPQGRTGRPDNSGRARQLEGTMALELARDGKNPFQIEMCFNGSPSPRTTLRMKISDYVDLQEGRLNGQQAFMAGKIRVEGDMGLLMQVATLTQ